MTGLSRLATVVVVGVGALAPASSPAHAQELTNRRDQARRAFLATPAGMYEHYCAHCHGPDGAGSGLFWDADMTPKPADLTALPAEGADHDYLVEAIRDGSAVHGKSTLCPPWGRTISPDNIQRLARYIGALGAEKTPAPAAALAELPTTGPADGPPGDEPFPWSLAGIVAAEGLVLLGLFLRSRSEDDRQGVHS